MQNVNAEEEKKLIRKTLIVLNEVKDQISKNGDCYIYDMIPQWESRLAKIEQRKDGQVEPI